MRILMILATSNSQLGGMEKHALELANGLSARGQEIHFASAESYRSGLDKGVTHHAMPAKLSRFNPGLLFRLRGIIKAGDFDIVHAQGSKASALISLVGRITSRQNTIATVHNFKSKYPRSGAFHQIIAVSHTLAGHIGYKNVSVVYNGISARKECASELDTGPPSSERPLWLAVGRLVPAKGFDTLIKAFAKTRGSLWIAGEGPERPRLEQLIAAQNQGERIRLLGHQTCIDALMNAADGIVISSRREGFSYVFAEALMAGKPIIATDVPIANEFLDPEFICPPSEPDQLAELMNNMDFRPEIQLKSRTAAKNHLTLDAMIDNTLEVYSKVAHDPS